VTIIVNISDAQASADPGDTLVTYSLGSCIGVCLYDPVAKIGGMLHCQLPTSTMDADRARQNPAMFADTGLTQLLQLMESKGAGRKRLKAAIAGGAQVLDTGGVFDIGRRNYAAVRKALWQHGLFIDAEDCGGSAPRTVYLAVADGAVTCKSRGQTTQLNSQPQKHLQRTA
jgi:chemotaxis protein CheD